MQNYLEQLLNDIDYATQHADFPEGGREIWDWMSEKEEEQTAPVRNLQEWTGISADALPPESMLNDEEVSVLFKGLKKMLDAYNCCFVICQGEPSERIQYATIKENFDQDVKVKVWHTGFFELCKPETEHFKCALGEYCQCAFIAELCKDMIDEDLTPEEERALQLEIELKHIQRKYGHDWLKYYPYHLDKHFDDPFGNPYDDGLDDDDDDDDNDRWKE